MKFRNGQFGLTPYIDIPLQLTEAASPLRRIVVGPGPRREEAKHAVELLLMNRGIPIGTSHGGDGIGLAFSTIPFRSA